VLCIAASLPIVSRSPYPTELDAFEAAFDSADVSVAAFVSGPAEHVAPIDIEQRVPSLFAVVDDRLATTATRWRRRSRRASGSGHPTRSPQ